MKYFRWWALAVATIADLITANAQTPIPEILRAKRPDKPNIIFILADDLGYGDLGCYGQKKIRTPNLDRMAAEGIRFTQHYAGNAVCAHSAALSGEPIMVSSRTSRSRSRAELSASRTGWRSLSSFPFRLPVS